MDVFVDVSGSDLNPGSLERPFATLSRALETCARHPSQARTVHLRAGTYGLDDTLTIDHGLAGQAPLTVQAYGDERVTIHGGKKLDCDWRPYKDGIWACDLPEARMGGLNFTQLFANGRRQIRARFPNRDDSRPDKRAGYTTPLDVIRTSDDDPLPARDRDMTYDCEPHKGLVFDAAVLTPRRWKRPEEAVIHIFQADYWGNLQWRLKHIDYERNRIWFGEGGHQMGVKWTTEGAHIGKNSRFYVENVFEELDAPMEWYLDQHEGKLYWMPSPGMDPHRAVMEAPRLKTLFRLSGSRLHSVERVTFNRLHFALTETTFLEPYEVPSLGDWALYRGGALLLEGTRDCAIKDCLFSGLGGNAVFANRFNRGLSVKGCTFRDIGDSGVLLVGELEATTGTQKQFPYECRVENNHLHDLGICGKQTAGVYLSRAKRITVGHNLMHDLPRASICIGDGTWGAMSSNTTTSTTPAWKRPITAPSMPGAVTEPGARSMVNRRC